MAHAQTLVLSTTTNYWPSLRSISPNLDSAYRATQDQSLVFQSFLTESLEDDVWLRKNNILFLGEEIRQKRYKRIIINNTHTLIPHLIAGIQSSYPESEGPEWMIHVFGDFTFRAKDWIHCGIILQGRPVRFICASESHRRLVESFLGKAKGKKPEVAIVPYPINEKVHSFDSDLRQRMRKQLNFSDTEKVLLYTGRLSQQKNIPALMQVFYEMEKDKRLRLIIAGSYDDVGCQTLGMPHPLGFSFYTIQKFYHSLPKTVRNRILFVGEKDVSELKGLYCAADVFVSLSLYHDEDYGMSVAEALSHGLPAVITDWGGYSCFAHHSHICHAVPVVMGKKGFKLSLTFIVSSIKKALDTNLSSDDRQNLGKKFGDQFGIQGVSSLLKVEIGKRISSPFQGFSPKFLEFASKSSPLVPGKGKSYEDYYAPYYFRENGK